MSAFGFAGPIPLELGNLAALKHLWLRNNQLSGETFFINPAHASAGFILRLVLLSHQLVGFPQG